VFVAEVPATVALAKIAAQRAHVANLRPTNLAGGVGQGREKLFQFGMIGYVSEFDRGSNAHHPLGTCRKIRHVNPRESWFLDEVEADHFFGLSDVFFLQVEQIGAAGEQFRRSPAVVEQGKGSFQGSWSVVGEVFHSRCSCRLFDSRCCRGYFFPCKAASTRSGLNGVRGTRTPRALQMALPIAAAVLMVGGSPIPITPRSGMSCM
jgi:hypothetical protein